MRFHLELDISANCFSYISALFFYHGNDTHNANMFIVIRLNAKASHGLAHFGTVMVVWRKSTAGGRVATARPLLSARAMPHFYPCGVRATAAHKYVRSFTHTRCSAVLLGRSQFILMYLQCECMQCSLSGSNGK